LSEVTPEQVRRVIARYLGPQQMVIVVVAPADAVKNQLVQFGTVEVVPMP
jgi:predicted Zn-dependent peptidase